jgi:hypothetical protein
MNRSNNIPFQVQQIIDGMLNTKDNVHIRLNYKMRLNELKIIIEQAIKKYDNEVLLSDGIKKSKKKAS